MESADCMPDDTGSLDSNHDNDHHHHDRHSLLDMVSRRFHEKYLLPSFSVIPIVLNCVLYSRVVVCCRVVASNPRVSNTILLRVRTKVLNLFLKVVQLIVIIFSLSCLFASLIPQTALQYLWESQESGKRNPLVHRLLKYTSYSSYYVLSEPQEDRRVITGCNIIPLIKMDTCLTLILFFFGFWKRVLSSWKESLKA